MILAQISHLARSALQKTGFDLVRFRSLNTILAHRGIDLVFDVGANTGQYARRLRELGYRGRIISFEPQKGPFAALSAAARQDERWTAVNIGLGSEERQETINVYSDSTMSSMLTLNQDKYIYDAKPVGSEVIDIRRLDSIIGQYAKPDDCILLKIDTQGFEKQVLAGAAQSLPRLAGVQLELSLTPFYAEQPHLEEMVTLLRQKGFALWQIQRGIYNPTTGQELEADGVFIRPREG